MKKAILGIIISLWLSASCIFAQSNMPDSAKIEVKSPIIQGEATNLKITVMKNDAPMSSYTGTIYIMLYNEDWLPLQSNDFTLPSQWIFRFSEENLWFKEFQKWLEIKKEWRYTIEVSDLMEDTVFGKQEIIVQKQSSNQWNQAISFLNPSPNTTLINEKVEIIASAADLPNSTVLIYIDNKIVWNTTTDSIWLINYTIPNISEWNHTLQLEIPDIEWNTLWLSDIINFTYAPDNSQLFNNITINPKDWFRKNDIVNISVSTDETVESVKMKLSDKNNENIILEKGSNGLFSTNVFLESTWDMSVSLELSAANNSKIEKQDNILSFTVRWIPTINNVKIVTDPENQSADITRDTIDWPADKYEINFWFEENTLTWSQYVEKEITHFTSVPYDTTVYVQITPYRNSMEKHWAASKTLQFIITKPEVQEPVCWSSKYTCIIWTAKDMIWSTENGYSWNCINDKWNKTVPCSIKEDANPQCWTEVFTCLPWTVWDNETTDTAYTWKCESNNKKIDCSIKREIESPKCTVTNISTRTEKIWKNHYLVWDKVDNVSKYIVYSSTTPSLTDRVKVYETSDTSYEYPFDYSSEEDIFMYFWIEWVCEDGEELELSWATKVQVWPSENFFLLICLTLLIYFWIKLVRNTED